MTMKDVMMKDAEKQQDKLLKLREALQKAGIDFIVTRKDDTIAHVNVWIGED